MDIHAYVVQHDKGFAPNPFWNVCTLACCKPRIRAKAKVGDMIIGFGSSDRRIGLGGRVIYWMKVDETLTFDEYWLDRRFQAKKAEMGGSLMACYGDNIYHRESGVWRQDYSFHSDGKGLGRGNLERDTGKTDRVLIGQEYAYWGGAGPLFPKALADLVPKGRAERCRYSEDDKQRILAWVASQPDRFFRSEPADWRREHGGAAAKNNSAMERIAC
jgi:Nucleotide modification associated domain 2